MRLPRIAAVLLLAPAALVAPRATAQEPVRLEWKFPENTKRTTDSTLSLQQTLTIMGQEIESSVEQHATSAVEIGARRADGSIPVTTRVAAVKASIDLPGGLGLTYDSADPGKGDDVGPPLDAIRDGMKGIVGTSTTVVIGKDGKVAGVEGTEAVRAHIAEAAPKAAETLGSRFSEATVRRNAEQDYARLPDGPVKPGDTWKRTIVADLGGGQIMTFESTFTYKGTVERDGRTLDRIETKSTAVRLVMSPDSSSPAKITGSDLTIAESAGTILFDRERGAVVETTSKDVITGSITLEVQGQELDAQIDLTIEESATSKPAA